MEGQISVGKITKKAFEATILELYSELSCQKLKTQHTRRVLYLYRTRGVHVGTWQTSGPSWYLTQEAFEKILKSQQELGMKG